MQKTDSHAHIGQYGPWTCNIDELLDNAKQQSITKIIISDLDINEFDENGNLNHSELSQIKMNDIARTKVIGYEDVFKLLFWIRPYCEKADDKLKIYLKENNNIYVGIKVHPKTSRTTFNEQNYKSYIELCGELKLPFCIHTDDDGFSNIEYVYEVAKKYPDINFIAVHMELGGDHKNAIKYISKCENLYGDTTLVNNNDVLMAIKECGAEKILFGSDANVFGSGSYDRYDGLCDMIVNEFGIDAAECVFEKNAKRIFGI